MLESLIEQWQIMRQAFAPMRLSRWQLTKLFAAQVNRDHPIGAKLAVLLFAVTLFWMVSAVTRPRRLEKELGLPVVNGSRTLKKDFAAVIERGRQMVSLNSIFSIYFADFFSILTNHSLSILRDVNLLYTRLVTLTRSSA